MSEGRLEVEVFAAGEIVPAFAVLDAVSNGVAEMGHTASFFWAGKAPAAALFTTAPFGMSPVEHLAWIQQRGGQALWDRLYEPFGVQRLARGQYRPLHGRLVPEGGQERGRSEGAAHPRAGPRRRRLHGARRDAEGHPARRHLPALERGTIDAVELLSPVNDLPLGFNRSRRSITCPASTSPTARPRRWSR